MLDGVCQLLNGFLSRTTSTTDADADKANKAARSDRNLNHNPDLKLPPAFRSPFPTASSTSRRIEHPDNPPPSSGSSISSSIRARSSGLRQSHSHSPTTDTNTNTNTNMAPSSPRSATYERLEGGMGPPNSSYRNGKRFGWKKFALCAGLLIAVVYFFGPRESVTNWRGSTGNKGTRPAVEYPYDTQVETDPLPGPPEKTHPADQARPPIPPIAPTTTPTNPTNPTTDLTFDTDPDPSKTTYCSAPYTPSAPLVQYALMIDAGSTGSRIHIYKFNNCGASPEYEYEVFKMTQPGLSSFAADPIGAAKSLDVLLQEAVRVVPEDLRKCTPIAVKATAGLRLLPGSQSKDIIEAVEEHIKASYPFSLHGREPVSILDGAEEGVYAWITANYLLNTIRSTTPPNTPTYAVLDLGGASTQIVFKPVFGSDDMSLEEGEHKYDLVFGGESHVLYQHSYLGYGLMMARKHVHRLVEFMDSIRIKPAQKDKDAVVVVGNPCLAKGTRRKVEVTDEKTGVAKEVVMDGEDIGSFEACDRVVQLVLAKDAICELKPCSFNGVYQPSLLDTFPSGKVLLLSYFYDRISPLLATPSPPLTVSTISTLATSVCAGRDAWLTHPHWGTNAALMAELEDRPEWCLDLTFMHALLRLGYEFGDERSVEVGKKIGGTELGWCLGATIAMVGGDLRCRI